MACISVYRGTKDPDQQYGCRLPGGYCMTEGQEAACGKCYSFRNPNTQEVRLQFRSNATRQKCDECVQLPAAGDGEPPGELITKFNQPCMKCDDGKETEIRLADGRNTVKFEPKKIYKKTDPNDPCKKCVPSPMFGGNGMMEIWEDCADQNPDAENCECDTTYYKTRPGQPPKGKCVCCDTPCNPYECQECRKVGRRKRCVNKCQDYDNHICVGGDPNTGTSGGCVCKYKGYNPNGLSAVDNIAGYEMCTESLPTPKSNCTGCECTVTCAGNLKLDPNTCSCVDQCADCTSNSQSFGALAVTNSCQECRRIDPDNFGCVDICVPPAVCDGSGGCYNPNSSLLSLLP